VILAKAVEKLKEMGLIIDTPVDEAKQQILSS